MIGLMRSVWSGPAVPLSILLGLVALWVFAWIALRIRWWRRTQLRRSSLGRPQEALDGLADGQLVTLGGELGLRGKPCRRFEDGKPVVACTMRPRGERQVPSAGVRAEGQLRLTLTDGPVALSGPIDVMVGSHESYPLAPWGQLARAVQSRIEQAEPSAEDALAKSSPVFRSIAAGDQVRARGVLRRLDPEESRDYREAGLMWTLTAIDEQQAVQVAFEGLPRVRGVVGAALRGARSRQSMALIAAGVVLVSLALAFLGGFLWRARATASRSPGAAPAGVTRLTEQACEQLAQQYRSERDRARFCRADADCTAEVRGGFWLELDGCWRFVNQKTLSLVRADRAAEAWLAGKCARDYEDCDEAPPVQCRDGLCAELPPEPVPPSWNRRDVAYAFSLFLPPDLVRRHVQPEDSLVRVWRNDRMSVSIDYGQYSNSLDEMPNRRPIRIDGRAAFIASSDQPFTDAMFQQRGPFAAVYFPDAPPCSYVRCGLIGGTKLKLNVWVEGTTKSDHDVAMTIVRSVTFW
jgi:hypothetical protein